MYLYSSESYALPYNLEIKNRTIAEIAKQCGMHKKLEGGKDKYSLKIKLEDTDEIIFVYEDTNNNGKIDRYDEFIFSYYLDSMCGDLEFKLDEIIDGKKSKYLGRNTEIFFKNLNKMCRPNIC